MFTGIVEGLREVRETRRGAEGMRLIVDLGSLAEEVKIGDSVAICGACLTVTELQSSQVCFDVVAETLSKTILGDLRQGTKVNIERPLKIGDRLHGHFVQGHVDGVGQIARKEMGTTGGEIAIETSPDITSQMIPKGSVAIDGISLTIVELTSRSFSIAVIPHTLSITTLGLKDVGDKVNLEVDMLGKWVRRILEGDEGGDDHGGLTMQRLREAGFA